MIPAGAARLHAWPQTQYTFEPFGNTTSTSSASTNSFAYTGRELDATGLYYYRARYYHPQLQRFVSEDPNRFRSGQLDLYEYVWDYPTNLKDPLGLWGYGGVFSTGFFGGLGSGTGATLSAGTVDFLGGGGGTFTSIGAYAPGLSNEVAPFGNNGGDNPTVGIDPNVASGGVFLTNANDLSQLAGPFAVTTIALGPLTIEIGRGSGGIKTLSVTSGVGFGLGYSKYCTNTYTNPPSPASFPDSANMAEPKCGCHANIWPF